MVMFWTTHCQVASLGVVSVRFWPARHLLSVDIESVVAYSARLIGSFMDAMPVSMYHWASMFQTGNATEYEPAHTEPKACDSDTYIMQKLG